MRPWRIALPLLAVAACAVVASRVPWSPLGGLRTSAEVPAASLVAGWNPIEPGGDTTCATGAPYRFFARPGSSERLLIYFDGGGACWTADTCNPDGQPTYMSRTPRQPPAAGIFDFDNPDNPFAPFSVVVVGYCTGDVHLGDGDTTYEVKTDTGVKALPIHHRGQVNAQAVLAWTYAHYPAPAQVVVAGSSAGGVATPFYASLVARHYPAARIIAIGDGANAFTSRGMSGIDQARWGSPGVITRHPGWEQYKSAGVNELYRIAARLTPHVRFYQVDTAYDDTQRAFLELAGTRAPNVSRFIREGHARVDDAQRPPRWFLAGGEVHTLLGLPVFYTYEGGGWQFRQWMAEVVAGRDVPDVDCGDCRRPEFAYAPRDLVVLDHAIARLSAPGGWTARDDEEPCPAEPAPTSLECAILDAGRAAGYEDPSLMPVFLDAASAAGLALAIPVDEHPLRAFNNQPGTTARSVVALLRTIRARLIAHQP